MLVSIKDDASVCAKIGDFGHSSRLFFNPISHKLKEFAIGDNATWYYFFGILIFKL